MKGDKYICRLCRKTWTETYPDIQDGVKTNCPHCHSQFYRNITKGETENLLDDYRLVKSLPRKKKKFGWIDKEDIPNYDVIIYEFNQCKNKLGYKENHIKKVKKWRKENEERI